MLKPGLQLKLSQQLTMTPQLQQAIKLLQMSTLDLSQEISEMVESNPMLDDEAYSESLEAQKPDSETSEIEEKPQNEGIEQLEGVIEEGWDNFYQSLPNESRASAPPPKDDRPLEIPDTSEQNLRDHLSWQISMLNLSERDFNIAEAIVDAVNDDGYLSISIENLLQTLSNLEDLQEDEVISVLHLVQHLDPIGAASRDLTECLHIQLRLLDDSIEEKQLAIELVQCHLADLARRDLKLLKKKTKQSESKLEKAINLIQTLEPKPGRCFATDTTEYITPDVYVHKRENQWVVSLNAQATPELKVNGYYHSLIKSASKDDASYMRGQLQEARWLIKSLETRNDTILRVSQNIVMHQQDFFEHGPEAMRPLILRDVAEQVDLHESTISRVTSRKYMHTPKGIFELKYFFSSHVATADGGECSAIAIQAMIKKLIDEENAGKPLSDSKISTILNDKGIKVARRTVAKYREAQHIPSSTERKRMS